MQQESIVGVSLEYMRAEEKLEDVSRRLSKMQNDIEGCIKGAQVCGGSGRGGNVACGGCGGCYVICDKTLHIITFVLLLRIPLTQPTGSPTTTQCAQCGQARAACRRRR
jgi:hypothetical protein